jgi:hypothetical protein
MSESSLQQVNYLEARPLDGNSYCLKLRIIFTF